MMFVMILPYRIDLSGRGEGMRKTWDQITWKMKLLIQMLRSLWN
jgi:hypothetical protein